MHQKTTIGMICAAVLLSILTLLLGATSFWAVGISGFFFVIGGTLIAAIVSEGYPQVEGLLRRLPAVFSARTGRCVATFLLAAAGLTRRPPGLATEDVGHRKELGAQHTTTVRTDRLSPPRPDQDFNPLVAYPTPILVDRHTTSC